MGAQWTGGPRHGPRASCSFSAHGRVRPAYASRLVRAGVDAVLDGGRLEDGGIVAAGRAVHGGQMHRDGATDRVTDDHDARAVVVMPRPQSRYGLREHIGVAAVGDIAGQQCRVPSSTVWSMLWYQRSVLSRRDSSTSASGNVAASGRRPVPGTAAPSSSSKRAGVRSPRNARPARLGHLTLLRTQVSRPPAVFQDVEDLVQGRLRILAAVEQPGRFHGMGPRWTARAGRSCGLDDSSA